MPSFTSLRASSRLTGLAKKAALLQSIGIGVTNLVFTFVGLWLIDRLGRRTLLYIGSFGYIASLGLVAWAFFTQHYAIVPVCIFAFIAAHAVGQGAVIWVFISEIFPNRHRAEGQTLGSFTHWIFAAAAHHVFPQDGLGFPCRLYLFLLRRHDGPPAPLGSNDGSRNQGRTAGADPKTIRDRIAQRYTPDCEQLTDSCADETAEIALSPTNALQTYLITETIVG